MKRSKPSPTTAILMSSILLLAFGRCVRQGPSADRGAREQHHRRARGPPPGDRGSQARAQRQCRHRPGRRRAQHQDQPRRSTQKVVVQEPAGQLRQGGPLDPARRYTPGLVGEDRREGRLTRQRLFRTADAHRQRAPQVERGAGRVVPRGRGVLELLGDAARSERGAQEHHRPADRHELVALTRGALGCRSGDRRRGCDYQAGERRIGGEPTELLLASSERGRKAELDRATQ